MSDTYLCLIPTDPVYVPELRAQRAALGLFCALLAADSPGNATIEVTDHVELVHPIECFDRIFCPGCGAEIAEDWWYARLDELYDPRAGFANLTVTVPCCDATCSLNDLDYSGPAGFARFRLQVLYPERDLATEEFAQLEGILGSSLRKVWIRL